ncbi:putative ribonuclease H-like domain-containing protein [Tanacetum coccineum]|uniref:Ribonuclease H-like domain-containing protein n=1 Tax=Tanacetum coccineum TaxID=301880 RepID=A0ABQ4XSE4_9ASTR
METKRKYLDVWNRGQSNKDLKTMPIIDSGCSGIMTENKKTICLILKSSKGGYLAFVNDSKGGRKSRKRTIKTSCLDFEKVSYVEELKFNLLSVSQICDKKHNVLFTDKECLILSPKFKFVDEDLVILRAPRKNDVYSLDLKNIIPSGGITCLVAKATEDEAVLWHRRLGHVNFKNLNKLVKGNLIIWVTKRFKIVLHVTFLENQENQSKREKVLMDVDIDLLTPSSELHSCKDRKLSDSKEPRNNYPSLTDELMKRGEILLAKGKEHVDSTLSTLSTANTPPQSGVAELTTTWNLLLKFPLLPTLRIHKIQPQSQQLLAKVLLESQTRRKASRQYFKSTQALLVLMSKEAILILASITEEVVCQTRNSLQVLKIQLKHNKQGYRVVMRTLWPTSSPKSMVYVDDIIFGSTKSSMVKDFEDLMQKEFKMSSMGELTFFLGLQVKQTSAGIFLSQDKYVKDILNKFDFRTIKPASTPIEAHKSLGKDEEGEDVDVHLYRSMIGCLMYLTASRPDIMFAVCLCARFQVTPKVSHLHAVKRIFRYLKHQPKLGLWYPKDSPFHLEAFSDSDYAGDNHDRRSTSGGCQYLGRRLVSWQCKKQTIVAISSTEAEYVAAASCCAQVLWMQNQLLDYGFNFMNTEIHIDNESTICIVKNPVFHSKTKHIQIRHHFIRDCYEQRLINVVKVHTDDNVADLLTKGFDLARFNFLVVTIGMMNP